MTSKPKTNFFFKLIFLVNILAGLLMVGAYLSTHISPNTIPYLYFLGLGYPLILGVLIIFSIFWLFFKRKFVLFNILIIALGWNHFNDFLAFNLNKKAVSAKSIKVLSNNVKIFNLYDLENRENNRDQLFDFLLSESADVYCFQEFYHQSGNTNFPTKSIFLDKIDAPYFQEKYTHKMRGDKFFGLVTFSKYKIVNKGEINFENDKNNYCIYSDIVKGDDTIRFFNAHIGSIRLQNQDYQFFDEINSDDIYKKNIDGRRILERLKTAYEKRAIQIEKIRDVISQTRYKIVFCGDLNDTPVSYCYNQLENRLIDSFVESDWGIGTTYIGKLPSNRIDYIFHSQNMLAVNFKTHNIGFSDHKPISCTINY